MNKIKIVTALVSLLLCLAGCSSFTDITPKGQSLLEKVSDLDMLLNNEYMPVSGVGTSDPMFLVNDFIPWTPIPTAIADEERGVPTTYGILVTWDESANRAALEVNGSGKYDTFYAVIGKIANPILQQVDNAIDDNGKAKQIKAEAYVLRAYMHYLAVNYYAKAYNPATAATDPGVPYMTEGMNMNEPTQKSTVQEVYDGILSDLNSAFALDALVLNPDPNRIGEAFAYAIQAKVLMSLRDYDGAFQAAANSLEINNYIEDNSLNAQYFCFVRSQACPEDLFYSYGENGIMATLSPEAWADMEDASVLKAYGPFDVNMRIPGPPPPFNLMTPYTVETNCGLPGLPTATYFRYIFPIFNPNTNAPVMGGPSTMGQPLYYSVMGLTTIDMYLTQAEVDIRKGDVAGAMDIIEEIRKTRIIPEQYTPLNVTNAAEAWAAMQKLSRTENQQTTKNFINLKRWNSEDAYKQTLTKSLFWTGADGQTVTKNYTLSPTSPLWIFPFPQTATAYNPNLTQNYEQ